MSMERWEPYFKPEVRSSGRTLHSKGVVNFSHGSDTQVQCYIRGSSPCKVSFSAESVETPVFSASCTCPIAKKGQTCKHMWAALTELDVKSSDFLEGKSELLTGNDGGQVAAAERPITASQTAYTEKRAAHETAYKEKQADYRKQQYQLQKQKLNAKKGKISKLNVAPSYPDEVEAALKYFEENGFELRTNFTEEEISVARKKLARVFHPDKGGSHQEITELNQFAEILLEYL